jgi:glutamate-5-semialdehyde dehydrogenase
MTKLATKETAAKKSKRAAAPQRKASPAAPNVAEIMAGLGRAAREAARELALASTEAKNIALCAAAREIRAQTSAVLAANRKDLAAAKAAGTTAAFLDRLTLDAKRIEAMAKGLEEIAALPDPVGSIIARWQRPNGLDIARVRVPLGVVGIIYESRPNVTADAGALCLKAGNAAILRGGSDSHHSSSAIAACLVQGLAAAGLPEAAIQLVPTTGREAVGLMLKGLDGAIDVIVPRGGKSLVARVQAEARVPVFAHLEGICHTYIDRSADLAMAQALAVNGKMRRTGVCGATETLLVDARAPAAHLATLIAALIEAGCDVRGDAAAQAADARVKPATEQDWSTEYLDAIISVRVVDGGDAAGAHKQK